MPIFTNDGETDNRTEQGTVRSDQTAAERHNGSSVEESTGQASFGIHPVVQRENRCRVSGGLLEVNLVSFCPATVSEPAA